MKNRYLEKFKHKSDFELLKILNNRVRHTEKALSAAEELLAKKDNDENDTKTLNNDIAKYSAFSLKTFFKKRFSPTKYFQTFGFGVILTNLSLALILIVLFELLSLFSGSSVILEIIRSLGPFFVLLALFLNNVIYKNELKISNNFMGRCINDILLFVILSIISMGVKQLKDPSYSSPILDIPSFIILIITMFFMVMVFEVFIGLIRRLFVRFNLDLL